MTIVEGRPTCFYHPTKVIFLYDNHAFLEAMDLKFGNQITMLTVPNPARTLQEIEACGRDINQSIFKVMHDVNGDTSNNCVLHFDVSKLLNLVYDKTRFDNIAVLVVDYEMPDMSGIELCQKLEQRKVFKIMLSAEVDGDMAIRAFNNSLIDKLLLKTSEDLYSEISLAVEELSKRYFRELSLGITNDHVMGSLFDNKLYRELFTGVASRSQAVEYYLVDNSGSFLFLDKDANPTWLIVRNQQELREQFELLQGYDLPDDIMTSVAKKEKLLFLFSEKEYKKPVSAWLDYIFSSTKLDDDYCYSVIQGKVTDSIDWSRVVSHAQYLAQRGRE